MVPDTVAPFALMVPCEQLGPTGCKASGPVPSKLHPATPTTMAAAQQYLPNKEITWRRRLSRDDRQHRPNRLQRRVEQRQLIGIREHRREVLGTESPRQSLRVRRTQQAHIVLDIIVTRVS